MTPSVATNPPSDVLLYRDASNRWGVLWEQSSDGGSTFIGRDLSDHTGELILRSPSGDVWLTLPTQSALSGLTVATVEPEHLSDPAWAARSGGSWAITITSPAGRAERLAAGYFALEH